MEVRVGENESLESALKRWKRKCARSGVLAEVRSKKAKSRRNRKVSPFFVPISALSPFPPARNGV